MLNKIRQHLRKINDSYEFKPLLSEIEESPVSPLGRFTFWTVVSLIIITICTYTTESIELLSLWICVYCLGSTNLLGISPLEKIDAPFKLNIIKAREPACLL